ncbi:MAG: hypothetical protein NZ841_08515 [Dictyoglomus sp.]|nr:hypothetical protein [Dictyoglomus sp.]MDW8189325.1 hypothetical protein [Dictyoglomus sp.]
MWNKREVNRAFPLATVSKTRFKPYGAIFKLDINHQGEEYISLNPEYLVYNPYTENFEPYLNFDSQNNYFKFTGHANMNVSYLARIDVNIRGQNGRIQLFDNMSGAYFAFEFGEEEEEITKVFYMIEFRIDMKGKIKGVISVSLA